MERLQLVGYTADLTCLVVHAPTTGARFTVPVDGQLVTTLAEVLELAEDTDGLALLRDLVAAPRTSDGDVAGADGPSAAAALLSLGRAATGQPRPPVRLDGSGSRLTPSEIQRVLRAGRSPESVAEQAGVGLDWVLRWYQPIAAEQRKVITSVLGGRQDRPGLGLSDDLIGDAVRLNLLERDIEADDAHVQWSAARPEGRPYWTVTLRFSEGERVRRATWRYDIGTGQVSPRDDLALELGWTTPVTHPAPGRLHLGHQQPEADDGPPPQRGGPPPPPPRRPVRWDPPAPPAGPRQR